MKCSVIAALLVIFAAGPALAEGTALTLAEAIARARNQAPQLQGADAALRAADANVGLSSLRPNPTLSVEAENVLGSGRYAGFGGGEKTFSLSMPLELGGKRGARVRVAEAERGAARIGRQVAQADLTFQITEAFVTLAASERYVEIAKASHALAERAHHAARERVRVGKASPIEEQRADVLRINAEVRLDKAIRATRLASATIARLTGSTTPVAITSTWFERTDAAVVGQPAVSSLALAAAEAELTAANARVDAARRDRIPDVTLTAGMRRYGESSEKAAVLALSVPLPLFNPGTAAIARSRAEYDRASAARRAVALEFEQSTAQAEADVADALAAARAATGPAFAAAEEAARIARIGYAEGKFPQLELIEAERSLAATRESSVDALAALHTARARLARLQGSNSPIYKD
ncbi:TolC family protein [Massilia arenae]|uniref:TolC family protein n=2 Tax=Massilia TaxID=149698 RepID=A0A5C7FR56_9BURK|nr:TolC family protein [Massilia arenae]